MRGKRPSQKTVTQSGLISPEYPEHSLRCPTYVTGVAAKEWRRITALLSESGVLKESDEATIAAYCVAFARWQEAEELITLHGPVITETGVARNGTTTSRLKKNPACTVAQENLRTMLRCASSLGLSPADRTRLAQPDTAEVDELALLLTPPPLESDAE